MADGPDGPLPDPRSVHLVAGLEDPDIVLGWVTRTPAWLDDGHRVTTLMTGVGTRDAVRSGAIRSVPTRLSAIPRILGGWMRPTVAVVSAVRDGRAWRFAPNVGWAPEAARFAERVVIEVAPLTGSLRGADLETPFVEGTVTEVVERGDPPDPPPTVRTGPVERAIGALVASLVPEGATVQWGPGKIAAAVVDALTVPVGVRSGLVTDELVALAERGLLVGRAQAAYLWGSPALSGLITEGRLRMVPISFTHDLSALAALDRLVAINTALEVALDGSANVEGGPGRPISGPGGHPDFCAGASRSRGGLSIIALPSTFGAGRTAIVDRCQVVTAPRFDVDVVVTEHGIADLRGADARERAERIVAVAAPTHRPALGERARELGVG